MTFVQARNAIVSTLEKHIGCPVSLSDDIADEPEYPYCYYSVLTPRASEHSFGLNEVIETENEKQRIRSERVAATLSFTFCSMNRETESGFIFGEDEALDLSEKAQGFFLLNAHNMPTEYGDIVIDNIGATQPRSSFLVEDVVRRYGFDIKFYYIRTDEMTTKVIERYGDHGTVYK